ncbi:hypothetical protein FE840_010345 [Peteryoungia desertarenae]|uniref:Uncharacterized protein n=1 Tax=Peteryoungia desertarenae TaxID=1813451 RepID=A0ABX6QMZ9_9HYPH|nr:hypothetical protein [Peteryoungia desertarenae]QLF69903.1 hypothetical protein FE840_010345 [Peteryoungia desertarenae]
MTKLPHWKNEDEYYAAFSGWDAVGGIRVLVAMVLLISIGCWGALASLARPADCLAEGRLGPKVAAEDDAHRVLVTELSDGR